MEPSRPIAGGVARRPPNRPRRMHLRGFRGLPVVAAIALIASAAFGAVSMTYTTSSTQSFTVKPPPVVWSAGPDSSGNNFAASFSLSSNATFYSITLKPVPEANVTWGNLTTLTNQDAVGYAVTVTGTSTSANAKILDFKVEFRNYGTDALIGTLDLKQASPSVSLGSLAAGAHWYAKMWVKLDTGTSASDLPASVSLTLTVS